MERISRPAGRAHFRKSHAASLEHRVVPARQGVLHRASGGDLDAPDLADEVCGRRHFGSGDLDLLEDLVDHLLGREVLGLRLVSERHPVAEHVVGDRFHVLGRDETAMPEEGVRASRQVQ